MSSYCFFATLFLVSRLALFGAEIRVLVVDHNGKPVRGADARLTNTQTGEEKTLKSDKKGKVFFGELIPGVYLLETGAEERIAAKSEVLSLVNPRDALDLTFKLPDEKAYRKVEEAANEAFNQRNYKEARKQYQKAVDMAPNNATGWSNLARAYAGVRDTEKMAEAIQKAVTFEPYQFETLQDELDGWMKYEEGWDLLERRQFEKAIKLLSESVRLSPNSSKTYYALAMAHAYSGNDAVALEHVERGLEFNPDDRESLNLKRILENRLGIPSAP